MATEKTRGRNGGSRRRSSTSGGNGSRSDGGAKNGASARKGAARKTSASARNGASQSKAAATNGAQAGGARAEREPSVDKDEARKPDTGRPAQGGGGVPLDMMLTEAAVGPGARWFPGRAGIEAAVRLALKPHKVAQRTAGLAAEQARIAAGRSQLAPGDRDRRFKDPAWQGNPLFRRLCQSYLATGEAVDKLVCDAGLDWKGERRLRFAAENVLDALAPSNFLATNPAAIKATLDSGGRNLVKGGRQMVSDLSRPPRIPQMVDRSKFKVGENLALTEGAVIHRTEVFELIHYKPQTSKVHELPLVVVPPMINKYYITDLAPGKSMVEHLLKEGQQVFTISWRNPGREHAEFTFESYVGAVLDAIEAARKVSGADQVHVLGLCAGGITAASTVAHLAAKDELGQIAGLSLGVTVLDQRRAGMTGAMMDQTTARAAIAESARRGYLDGRALAGVFAWLRPNDLVWNYWVNNYLLGKDPPAFDILYWNSDSTRMAAGLHRDFVEMSLQNALAHPGTLEVLGTPIDLSTITVDTYVIAGIADHITPWESCYRSALLLGSEPRFVLSTSGHIAALVNPPTNEKASFRHSPDLVDDPQEWLKVATKHPGSWWTDWSAWLGERSGEDKAAPKRLGGKGYTPIEDAPGTYVLQE